MKRTRIKICGITRVEDALICANAGVDAIGLVFYETSPRYVTIEQAARIVAALPPFVSTVALFVDAAPLFIQQVIERVAPNYLQFHGQETPEFCDAFNVSYFKALRVKPDTDILMSIKKYSGASAILLDNWHPTLVGGTGEAFDWSCVPPNSDIQIILAGGLDAANVAQAIKSVQPFGVDVSGGVELEKGVKNGQKIVEFVETVNKTCCSEA